MRKKVLLLGSQGARARGSEWKQVGLAGGSGNKGTVGTQPCCTLILGLWEEKEGVARAAGAGQTGFLVTAEYTFLLLAVTPSDYYVTLWLPTACSHRLQTRTVKNSRSPVWNQSFHFRIHSQLKVGRAGPALPPAHTSWLHPAQLPT